MSAPNLHQVATEIFGPDDPQSIQRWVDYWEGSQERNRSLLEPFKRLALLDFRGKRVLDVGCGTGGMSGVVGDQCRHYVGLDNHRHVIRFAQPQDHCLFLQGDGTRLPFRTESFDFIFAFDVIEHLIGGESSQREFLLELRRVLRPLGMILLTTPNWLYPYDAHSDLYFTHFFPISLADRYIRWLRPGFLKEHESFREIQIMSPSSLRRCLRGSRLSFLHQLPCGLDRTDYARIFPLRSPLLPLGLGWLPHAEFWGILSREEARPTLRLKLSKHWYYEQNQPSQEPAADFAPRIDFQDNGFGRQLGAGWFWHERDQQGFRWTGHLAECYLQSSGHEDFLELSGYSPYDNHFVVEVDGVPVGEHEIEREESFSLRLLLPFRKTSQHIFRVCLRCRKTHRPGDSKDDRDLGLMIFSIGLAR